MKGFQGLDAIDQGILHFLSLYEHLNLRIYGSRLVRQAPWDP